MPPRKAKKIKRIIPGHRELRKYDARNLRYRPGKFKKLIVDFGFGRPENLDTKKDTMTHGHELTPYYVDEPLERLFTRKIKIKNHSPNIRIFYNSHNNPTPLSDILKKYQTNSVDEWRFNRSLEGALVYERKPKKTAREFFRIIKPGGRIFIMADTPQSLSAFEAAKKVGFFIDALWQGGFKVEINSLPKYEPAFFHAPDTLAGFNLNTVTQIIATKPLN